MPTPTAHNPNLTPGALDQLDPSARAIWHARQAEMFADQFALDRASAHAALATAWATIDQSVNRP